MIRTVKFDDDSLDEMLKALSVIKSFIGDYRAKKTGRSKRKDFSAKFESCIRILDTDISSLYQDVDDTDRKFYVYLHCDPRDKIAVNKHFSTTALATMGATHIPFYVGKGCGNRAYVLDRNETHRKIRQKLKSMNTDVHVQILKDNLTEREALCLESKIIDLFGVIGKGGKLCNLDEGCKAAERRNMYLKEYFELSNINRELHGCGEQSQNLTI